MPKVNRFLALAMVLVLAFSVAAVAGCKKEAAAELMKIGLVFDVGGLGDKSFNDSAYAGLTRAEGDFDIETQYLEPTEGGADRAELLRSLAQEGYELVFAVGFLFTEAVTAASTEFPDTKFALIDGYIENLTEESNVVCLGFTEHEGSFLVGAIAALLSETGKVGFVGGMDSPLIQKFEAGYRAGVAYVDKGIQVVVNYVGSTPDAFKNPTVGKELALAQYDAGCDVIYHASGQSGVGVISAAAEREKWVIGVDSDQYEQYAETPDEQPYIITSMLKRVDVSVYETIEAYVNGEFEGGYQTFNLAVDGVGYATTNPALPEDVKTEAEAIKAKVMSGEIVVPTNYEELDSFLSGL
jgi:basic membrane protein A